MPSVENIEPSAQATMAPPATMKPVRGLVLSGGGAQAVYEVGVIKALLAGQSSSTNYAPLNIDIISGTSAGSVNACLLLSELDQDPSAAVDYLEKTWLDDIADVPNKCNSGAFRIRANPLNFASPGCYSPGLIAPFIQFTQDSVFLARNLLARGVNFFAGTGSLSQRTLELVDISMLVSDDPLQSILRKRVRFDRIRSSQRMLRIATTNWSKGDIRIFNNADMTDDKGMSVIMGSSAIPGIYPWVEIEGEQYCDGGVIMNTPLKPAIDAGASQLHVIYMNPDASRVPLPPLPNTLDDVARALVIGFGATVNKDIQTAEGVNEAIDFLKGGRALKDVSRRDISTVLLAAAGELRARKSEISHRTLEVHRYHPDSALEVGMLSFDREGLRRLIDRGYKDGVGHDCVKNKCLLASPKEAAAGQE
jgi:NTE family protein